MEICELMRETLNRVARLTKKMLHFSNTDHSDDEIQDEDELKVILGFKLVPDLLLLFFLKPQTLFDDTTSIRKKPIGKPSIRHPSVGQVFSKGVNSSSRE